ncbi:hypothetical protein CD133_10965, partial [Staphylococcus massiliensis CCUG 55927]
MRHSNVLAWLFSPYENHNLRDSFMKKFLHIYVDITLNELDNFNYLELLIADNSDLKVRREWEHIDLLLISETNKIIVAIENKVYSTESEGQLERYTQVLNHEFENYQVFKVYLTPEGDLSSIPDEWVNMSYADIIHAIDSILQNDLSLDSKVKDFLSQYLDILRRHILTDTKLEKICREIYFKHKDALDLIYEYKPDINSDINHELTEIIKENEHIIMDDCNKSYIRFTTNTLDDLLKEYQTVQRWTSTQRPLLFEIKNFPNRVSLHLELGPGETELREKIHHITSENSRIFRNQRKLSQSFTNLYTKNLATNNELNGEDHHNLISFVTDKFVKFI